MVAGVCRPNTVLVQVGMEEICVKEVKIIELIQTDVTSFQSLHTQHCAVHSVSMGYAWATTPACVIHSGQEEVVIKV